MPSYHSQCEAKKSTQGKTQAKGEKKRGGDEVGEHSVGRLEHEDEQDAGVQEQDV